MFLKLKSNSHIFNHKIVACRPHSLVIFCKWSYHFNNENSNLIAKKFLCKILDGRVCKKIQLGGQRTNWTHNLYHWNHRKPHLYQSMEWSQQKASYCLIICIHVFNHTQVIRNVDQVIRKVWILMIGRVYAE